MIKEYKETRNKGKINKKHIKTSTKNKKIVFWDTRKRKYNKYLDKFVRIVYSVCKGDGKND